MSSKRFLALLLSLMMCVTVLAPSVSFAGEEEEMPIIVEEKIEEETPAVTEANEPQAEAPVTRTDEPRDEDPAAAKGDEPQNVTPAAANVDGQQDEIPATGDKPQAEEPVAVDGDEPQGETPAAVDGDAQADGTPIAGEDGQDDETPAADDDDGQQPEPSDGTEGEEEDCIEVDSFAAFKANADKGILLVLTGKVPSDDELRARTEAAEKGEDIVYEYELKAGRQLRVRTNGLLDVKILKAPEGYEVKSYADGDVTVFSLKAAEKPAEAVEQPEAAVEQPEESAERPEEAPAQPEESAEQPEEIHAQPVEDPAKPEEKSEEAADVAGAPILRAVSYVAMVSIASGDHAGEQEAFNSMKDAVEAAGADFYDEEFADEDCAGYVPLETTVSMLKNAALSGSVSLHGGIELMLNNRTLTLDGVTISGGTLTISGEGKLVGYDKNIGNLAIRSGYYVDEEGNVTTNPPIVVWTVTFDPAGGSEVTAQTVVNGSKLVETDADTARAYYDFAAWNDVNGAAWNFAEGIVTADMTLTAQWTPVEYEIGYDLEGGALAEGVTNPASYNIETPELTLASPAKDGFVFGGWYTDDECEDAFVYEKGVTNGNLMLYADWLDVVATVNGTGYATIEAALAVAQSGDVVEVLPGEHEIANTAVIPANVTLKGAGTGETTVVIVTTASGLTVGNANVTIRDMTIDGSAITSGGYKTLVNVRADGCVIDNVVMTGGGGSTWNSSILVETLPATATFIVKNSAMSGAFRGVLRESCSGNIVIENCDITATYTFNIDGGNGGTVTVTGGAIHGWTSYSGVENVTFTDVTFSKGGYDCVAAYVDTNFVNCSFDAGFEIYAQTSPFTFTLTDCEKDGVQVTAENFTELFSDSDVWTKCDTYVDGVLVGAVAKITRGETTAWFKTIEAALAAAESGDTVEVLTGEHEIANTAVIPAGVTLKGAGTTATTVKIVTEASGITVNNANVTIRDMTIDGSAITSGGYKTLVNVRADGCVIDNVVMTGGGRSTWNSSILVETLPATATFTVKNSTISGAFRGVLRESCSGNIVIENCEIDAVYPFNIDGGNGGAVTVTGGALHGWTSYSGVENVTFTDVTFSMGNSGYDLVAAYVDTNFVNCSFDAEFDIYAQTSPFTFTLTDCEKGGEQVTAENFTEFFSDSDVWIKCDTYVNGVLVGAVAIIADGETATQYKSVQAALDAAHEMTGNVKVELIKNVKEVAVIHQKAGLNLTVDGAGSTVTGQFYIDGDGRYDGADALTIQNVNFAYDASTYDDAFIDVPSTKTAGKPYTTGKYNYAHNVAVANCTFEGEGEKTVAFRVASGAGANGVALNGLTVTGGHSFAQLVGVKNLTITDCTVTGTKNGINISGGAGTAVISNTWLAANRSEDEGYTLRLKDASEMAVTLSDNTFSGVEGIINKAAASGGKITIETGEYAGQLPTEASELTVRGGLFTVAPSVAVCANGLYPIANNDPDTKDDYPYTVGEDVVATIARDESAAAMYYATLEEAFAAAQDGDTIAVLADSAGNGIQVPQGKFSSGLTVDFGGYTYTMDGELVGSAGTQTQAFQLLKDNNITFRNGKIESTKAKMLVQNYSNLTLDNMVLTLENSGYTSAYTLSNNNGSVVISNTTINANPAGGYAFDVCRYASYLSVNVTVAGSSKINGDIEISASGSDAKEGFGLALNGGTINGSIVLDDTAKAAMESTPDKVSITKQETVDVAAPADYAWTKADENGVQKLAKAVAQIGETQYASLAEAVAAVPAGTATTITMIDNTAIDVVGSAITIPANKVITIDLNGYQVVGTASQGSTSALITNRGTLTIKDSSAGGTGKLISGATETWVYDGSGNYAGSYASNTITNSGTLTVESGYIENLSTGSATYAIDNNSSGGNAIANINGGTVKAHSVAIRQFANSTTYENTVNISGGTVTAGYSGIWIQLPGSDAGKAMKAALNVTGGKLEGGSYAFYDYTYGNNFASTKYTLSGGTFVGDIFSFGANIAIADGEYTGEVAIKQAQASTVSVTGGHFADDVYTYGDNASEGFITGGTFKILTYEYEGETYDCDWIGLLAEDYTYEENENGEYVVRPAHFVASVTTGANTKKYESLEEAFAAAEDGSVITLLESTSGNGIQVPQGKFASGLTVDFGGYTYTMDGEMVGSAGTQTQAFQLLKDNKITFRNGKIESTKALMLVQNYSNLTLDNMELTLDNRGYTSAYTLSNNNGKVMISDTTINANPAGGYAFDVCRYASYPSVNVTVAGSSKINGDIEISASASDAKEGFGLALNGGTINGSIVLDDTAKAAMESAPDKVSITKQETVDVAAPADYAWTKADENGVQKLAKAVAQIGETQYASLAEAVAAVPAGTATTITMIADEAIAVSGYAVTIPTNKNVVLDLNGHEVIGQCSEGGTSALICNLGTLTINDSGTTGKLIGGADTTWTWDGSDNYAGSYASNLIRNEGTLTVNGGTLYNASTGSAVYAIDNYNSGKVTINGGTVDAAKASAIRMFYNNGGKVTVNGGTVGRYVSDDDCSYMGIQVMSGTNAVVEVNGGTVAGMYALYSNGTDSSAVSISGGVLDGYVGFGSAGPDTISITGGVYYAWVGTWGEQTGFISGGQFAEKPAAECIAQGKAAVLTTIDDEDWYIITEAEAEIDSIGYAKLADAVKASESMEAATIVLLKDVTAEQTTINKGVTLDLGGKTLTGQLSAYDGDVTVTNGTLTGRLDAYDNANVTLAATGVVNGQAVVWGDGTYGAEGCKTPTLNVYGTITNSGDSAITTNGTDASGAKINIYDGAAVTSTDDIAIYQPSGNVTINGGTITGATAIYQKSGTLAITGGTLNATGMTAAYSYNGSGANATGDALVVENCKYPNGAPMAAITGGSFNSAYGKGVGGYYGNGATELATVTSTNNGLTVLKDQKWAETETAGTYKLVEKEYVAEIEGGAKYENLDEAIAAAQAGEKVILLVDLPITNDSGYYELRPEAAVTLDLDGHTISGGALDIYGPGALTITDGSEEQTGTITGVKHGIWVNPGANLTLAGSTVNAGTGCGIATEAAFTMTGGTINAASKDSIGVSAQGSGSMTMTGGAINATGEGTTGVSVQGSGTANLNGGTVTTEDWGVTVFGSAKLTVDGTAITSANNPAISTNGNAGQSATIIVNSGEITSTNEIAIYQPSGNVTINGGTITGATAVYQKSGTLAITGGTLNATGATAAYSYNGSGANATGDALVVENCKYPNGAPVAAITGGSFSSANGKGVGGYYGNGATELATVTSTNNGITVPENEKWAETETAGTYKLVEKEYVAEIEGGAKYENLDEAIAAAQAGEKVILLVDLPITNDSGYYELRPEAAVTLDLDGHIISGGALDIYGPGALTITDGSEEQTGAITGVKHGIWVNPGANLTLAGGTVNAGTGIGIVVESALTMTGGTVNAAGEGTTGVSVQGSGTANLNGGTVTTEDWGVTVFGSAKLTVDGTAITSANNPAISTNGNAGQSATIIVNSGEITSTNDIAIYQPSGNVTINGGTITGATAVYQKSGTLAITGGTLNATGMTAAYSYNGSGANATGDALVVENCKYPNGAPVAAITGGSFSSANGKGVGGYYGNGATELATVTSTNNGITVPENEKWAETETAGTYKLVEKDYVAEIEGGAKYENLDEAIAAAQAGEKVILLVDLPITNDSGYYELRPEAAVTLDLDGHTISGGALDIYGPGALTITDGSEEQTGAITGVKHGIWVNPGANLTLAGGTVNAGTGIGIVVESALTMTGGTVNAAGEGTTGVSVQGSGTANLNGGTVTTEDWGVTVFGSAKLTVDGTAITSANNPAISTNGNAGQSATIIVNSGEITSTNEIAIYQPSGNVTINGGTITGATAVYQKSGTLAITGGTLNATGATAAYSYNGSGANATGDVIVVESCGYPNGTPVATLTGTPALNAADADAKQVGYYEKPDTETAGTVTSTNNAYTVPSGYMWRELEENPGTYKLVPAAFTVTFNANGGTGDAMPAQEISPNTPTALNANTYKFRGVFTGWNTEADGTGTAYADKAEVTLDADLELYAQWAACRVMDMLTLNDNIAYRIAVSNFTGTGGALDYHNWTIMCEFDGETTYLPIPDSDTGTHRMTLATADSRKMGEDITVTAIYGRKVTNEGVVTDEGVVLASYTSSVRNFCETKLTSSDTSASLRKLCEATLTYGAYAQRHFGYKTGDLANKNLGSTVDPGYVDLVPSTTIDTDEYKFSYTGTIPTELRRLVPTLVLNCEVTMSFAVQPTSGMTFLYNGKEMTTTVTNGYSVAKIMGIKSNRLSQDYAVTIKGDTSGNEIVVHYSPFAFAAENQSEGDYLGELCRALYLYGLAADAYFGN